MNRKKGVTMVALIITIIVTIIISGTVIVTSINSSVVDRAKEATFKSNVNKYMEELETYNTMQKISDRNYQISSLNANENLTIYIPSLKQEDENDFIIENGKLTYINMDELKIKWLEEIGCNIGGIRDKDMGVE